MTTYSYSQLEDLWIQAGGSTSLAPLMAAIAEAESSGNSTAYNPSGASGLWQIMMPINAQYVPGGEANVWNPQDNAAAAVAIEKEQGLSAWTTYTSGAYQQFLRSGVAPTGVSGTATTTADTTSAAGLAGLGSLWPTDITSFFDEANTFVTTLMWITKPSSWLRIGAFIAGVGLLLFAIHAFIAAASDQPIFKMPSVPPVVPVPV